MAPPTSQPRDNERPNYEVPGVRLLAVPLQRDGLLDVYRDGGADCSRSGLPRSNESAIMNTDLQNYCPDSKFPKDHCQKCGAQPTRRISGMPYAWVCGSRIDSDGRDQHSLECQLSEMHIINRRLRYELLCCAVLPCETEEDCNAVYENEDLLHVSERLGRYIDELKQKPKS